MIDLPPVNPDEVFLGDLPSDPPAAAEPQRFFEPRRAERQELVEPASVEMEAALIGGILSGVYDALGPGMTQTECYHAAAELCSWRDFYLEGNGLIFRTIGELVAKGENPDPQTLLDELRARGLLERAGGSMRILDALEKVASGVSVETHARRVAEKAQLRKLVQGCQAVIREACRQDLPALQVADLAEKTIGQVAAHLTGGDLALPLDLVVDEQWAGILQAQSDSENLLASGDNTMADSRGMATGLVDLDRRIGAIKPGWHTCSIGRTAMGKTSLLLSIILHQLRFTDATLMIFSMEMLRADLFRRLLAMHTFSQVLPRYGVGTVAMEEGNLTDQQKLALRAAKDELRVMLRRLIVDDNPDLTTAEIRARSRTAVRQHGCRAVFVDHLGLVAGSHGGMKDFERLGESSGGLGKMAKALGIQVFSAAQTNREGERQNKRRPTLAGIYGGDVVAHNAEIVLAPYRPAYYDTQDGEADSPASVEEMYLEEAEIVVLKHRYGPTGYAKVLYATELARFLNAMPQAPKWVRKRGGKKDEQ